MGEWELRDPRALTGDDWLARIELWEQFYAALSALPPVPRQFVLAHHFDEVSIAALALQYGRSPHAVEQALRRSRLRLRGLLLRGGGGEIALQASGVDLAPPASAPPSAF